eukprot:g2743.t1 g2743   contig12:714625-715487(+)
MDSTPIIEEEESALILKELKEISNKHSSYLHQSSKPTASSSPKLQPLDSTRSAGKENNKDAGKDELDDSFIDDATTFLNKTSENRELNQYWYSKSTIETLCNAIRESIDICGGRRVAFLSTPSLFFSLTKDERDHCALLDFDTSWKSSSGYHFYDFNDPEGIEEHQRGTFDVIVIDPPFVSHSVWKKYATTARLLMRQDRTAHVITTTVDENAQLMSTLFDCKSVLFRPSIPHLVYQYSVFTNYASSVLGTKNLEIQMD